MTPAVILARLTLVLGAICGAAGAQVHETRADGYIVRANAVSGTLLPEDTRLAYAIPLDHGMLNVVVLRGPPDGLLTTIPARVSASVQDLRGLKESIEMREVLENDRISYVGAFRFEPRQMMRFDVTVEGAHTMPIKLEFQKRLYPAFAPQ